MDTVSVEADPRTAHRRGEEQLPAGRDDALELADGSDAATRVEWVAVAPEPDVLDDVQAAHGGKGLVLERKVEDGAFNRLQALDRGRERSDVDEGHLGHGGEEARIVDPRSDVDVTVGGELGDPLGGPGVLEQVMAVVRRRGEPVAEFRQGVPQTQGLGSGERLVFAAISEEPHRTRDDGRRLQRSEAEERNDGRKPVCEGAE